MFSNSFRRFHRDFDILRACRIWDFYVTLLSCEPQGVSAFDKSVMVAFECDLKRCSFKRSRLMKALSQCVQTWGFAPVCHNSCLLKLFWDGNLFSHLEHRNGFSLVCVLSCSCKTCLNLNFLSQWLQANGLSSEWTLWCCLKLSIEGKVLPQVLQVNWRGASLWV